MCIATKKDLKFCILTTIISFFVFSGLMLMIVLLSLTVLQKVKQNQYGIPYNTFSNQFSTPVEQGTYTLNVGDTFILKDRTLIDVNAIDKLVCVSKDLIKIQLFISAQYQLNKNELIPIILTQFNDQYDTFLTSIVSNIILRICGLYNAEDFYLQRSAIDTHMFNALINEINNSTMSFGSVIENFQLQNITFPQDYDNVITEKQLVAQNIITSQNNRTTQLIIANTSLLQNQRQAQIKITNANNQAQINIKQAQKSYDTILDNWNRRASVYAAIMLKLDLNQSQFIDYMKAETIRGSISQILSI